MIHGWIGVDFDGTLAEHHENSSFPGKPVPKMIEKVKKMLDDQYEVRIMTARASKSNPGREQQIEAIEKWCVKHLGEKLTVTNEKDFAMIQLWDDRAIQIVTNTGETIFEYYT